MSKKRRKPRGWLVEKNQIDIWLDKAKYQLMAEEFQGTVNTCKRILRYLPKKEKIRAEVLGYLGNAYGMQNNFNDAYTAYREALLLDQEDSILWANYGKSCLFTIRSGKALGAFEHAVQLERDGTMADEFAEDLETARKMVKNDLKLRGPDFTLDQLIKQQDLFQDAMALLEKNIWEEAVEIFHEIINMGDCLPQTWGNLGVCLMMLKRYDEAETAFKSALEIDPEYKFAKVNLQNLADQRENPDQEFIPKTISPFEEINTRLNFIEADTD